MPDSPTTEPESDFVCACEEWMRSACAGEPFYKELEDKRYCVLHLPETGKQADFEPAVQQKLNRKDFNFRGVWFPNDVSFRGFDFSGPVDFSGARFSASSSFIAATFRAKMDFYKATFIA